MIDEKAHNESALVPGRSEADTLPAQYSPLASRGLALARESLPTIHVGSRRLAVISRDNVEQLTEVACFQQDAPVTAMALLRNYLGLMLAAGAGGRVSLWRLPWGRTWRAPSTRPWRALTAKSARPTDVRQLALNPHRELLVLDDDDLTFWGIQSGKRCSPLESRGGVLSSLGNQLAHWDTDSTGTPALRIGYLGLGVRQRGPEAISGWQDIENWLVMRGAGVSRSARGWLSIGFFVCWPAIGGVAVGRTLPDSEWMIVPSQSDVGIVSLGWPILTFTEARGAAVSFCDLTAGRRDRSWNSRLTATGPVHRYSADELCGHMCAVTSLQYRGQL